MAHPLRSFLPFAYPITESDEKLFPLFLSRTKKKKKKKEEEEEETAEKGKDRDEFSEVRERDGQSDCTVLDRSRSKLNS